MTTYVIRNGVLVDKSTLKTVKPNGSHYPAPRVSRFQEYQSPIDGSTITSDRQRERDLYSSNSYDPRDLRRDHVYSKGRQAQQEDLKNAGPEPEQLDFWRDE